MEWLEASVCLDVVQLARIVYWLNVYSMESFDKPSVFLATLKRDCILMHLPDERHLCSDPLAILHIIILEELNQFGLLVPDSGAEKLPKHKPISKEA